MIIPVAPGTYTWFHKFTATSELVNTVTLRDFPLPRLFDILLYYINIDGVNIVIDINIIILLLRLLI